MAPIPKPQSNTVRAIYHAYEQAHTHYDSLGISVGEIGTECDRALWYSFRWTSKPEVFDGKLLRLFATGNLEEDRLVEDLRAIGVEVYGQQDRIRLVGGHVRGKCDGKAMNVPEAPLTEHLCEFKSSNAKGMKELQKLGCKEAKPQHYGQCQIGMHQFGLTRALYLVACKDTDTLYAERIEYDVEWCLRALARAERIINLAEPPSRISEKPDVPPCLLCKHKAVCHESAWPRSTCRSCLHSSPEMGGDGHWSCVRWSKPLSTAEQQKACPAMLYIPALVPGEQLDIDEEAETVTYRLRSGRIWVDGGSNDNVA